MINGEDFEIFRQIKDLQEWDISVGDADEVTEFKFTFTNRVYVFVSRDTIADIIDLIREMKPKNEEDFKDVLRMMVL